MRAVDLTVVVDCHEHLVHFYSDAAEFDDTVTRHLLECSRRGTALVLICTPEHRRQFDRLFPPALSFDAEETLAAITTDAGVDRVAFDRVVGGALRQAAAGGREVCAYGEMVELLWRSGHVVLALELEQCWNELSEELGFSLLCAYSRDTVGADGEGLARICELHSGVLRHFPASSEAPSQARRFLREVLETAGHDEPTIEDAQLVVSELATNAVLHARSPFSVTARADEGGIRVSVRDGSHAPPRLRGGDPFRISGRGLELVSKIALQWGVERTADGKAVWAQL